MFMNIFTIALRIASWSNLATEGELPLGPSALIIEDDNRNIY
jgi:hypothetical protein